MYAMYANPNLSGGGSSGGGGYTSPEQPAENFEYTDIFST